ncbi:uncharacterized protein BcabD6B2_56440 [Babesia caballi]|uniref:Uncharacterized protein n=1 Tax=Babesia caballi TaxID=5871 RepID=A0AAV4M1F7_BABCB|nr:hypothetical protein, conserved [Babesia caballi]
MARDGERRLEGPRRRQVAQDLAEVGHRRVRGQSAVFQGEERVQCRVEHPHHEQPLSQFPPEALDRARRGAQRLPQRVDPVRRLRIQNLQRHGQVVAGQLRAVDEGVPLGVLGQAADRPLLVEVYLVPRAEHVQHRQLAAEQLVDQGPRVQTRPRVRRHAATHLAVLRLIPQRDQTVLHPLPLPQVRRVQRVQRFVVKLEHRLEDRRLQLHQVQPPLVKVQQDVLHERRLHAHRCEAPEYEVVQAVVQPQAQANVEHGAAQMVDLGADVFLHLVRPPIANILRLRHLRRVHQLREPDDVRARLVQHVHDQLLDVVDVGLVVQQPRHRAPAERVRDRKRLREVLRGGQVPDALDPRVDFRVPYALAGQDVEGRHAEVEEHLAPLRLEHFRHQHRKLLVAVRHHLDVAHVHRNRRRDVHHVQPRLGQVVLAQVERPHHVVVHHLVEDVHLHHVQHVVEVHCREHVPAHCVDVANHCLEPDVPEVGAGHGGPAPLARGGVAEREAYPGPQHNQQHRLDVPAVVQDHPRDARHGAGPFRRLFRPVGEGHAEQDRELRPRRYHHAPLYRRQRDESTNAHAGDELGLRVGGQTRHVHHVLVLQHPLRERIQRLDAQIVRQDRFAIRQETHGGPVRADDLVVRLSDGELAHRHWFVERLHRTDGVRPRLLEAPKRRRHGICHEAEAPTGGRSVSGCAIIRASPFTCIRQLCVYHILLQLQQLDDSRTVSHTNPVRFRKNVHITHASISLRVDLMPNQRVGNGAVARLSIVIRPKLPLNVVVADVANQQRAA